VNSIFKKGDCIVFKLDNKKFGGAIIIDEEENTELGCNLIALLDIEQELEPSINEFKIAKIQYIRAHQAFEPFIFYYSAKFYEEETKDFEIFKIGNLRTKNEVIKGYGWCNWETLKLWNSMDKGVVIDTQLKVSDFLEEEIKTPWWQFWKK
jgi:hypothetical protein